MSVCVHGHSICCSLTSTTHWPVDSSYRGVLSVCLCVCVLNMALAEALCISPVVGLRQYTGGLLRPAPNIRGPIISCRPLASAQRGPLGMHAVSSRQQTINLIRASRYEQKTLCSSTHSSTQRKKASSKENPAPKQARD